MNVELFTQHAKEWNLTSSDIEQAAQLFTQDHGPVSSNPPSKLLLFLYAKRILASKSSNLRLEEFQTILTGKSIKAHERLTTIVEKGETSPTKFTFESASMFDDFITKHEEWKGNDSFVIFRDHQDLKGKSHALVERFQKSGLCFMHACVVVQHYLVAMNNQEEVPMLNMAEYLKGYMKSNELYELIWNNKGGDSLNFLKKILNKTPASKTISHCCNGTDFDVMDEYLHSYGPGLVSGFCVEEKFTLDDWQHLGEYEVDEFKGQHAMALVGYRIVDGKKRYLLQNWWKSKPYVEVDSDYLISSNAMVHFIKERQEKMGDYPISLETLVECESGIDASENFISEGF